MATTQALPRQDQPALAVVSCLTAAQQRQRLVSLQERLVTIVSERYGVTSASELLPNVQDNSAEPRDSRTPAALYRSICVYLEYAAGKAWRSRFDPTRLYYLAGLELLRQAWDTIPPLPVTLLGTAMDAGMIAHNAMVEAERRAVGRELGSLMTLSTEAERAALQAEAVRAKADREHDPEAQQIHAHALKARKAADRCRELKQAVLPQEQIEVCA